MSLDGVRAWVQAEDWIAFLAGNVIMLRGVLASSQPALPFVASGTVVLNAGHGTLDGYPLR